MASRAEQLHIFLFPLMAAGHIIPMVNLAKLFVERGIKVTLLTTPTSTALLRRSVDEACDSGHLIHLLVLRPPSSLPDGRENLTSPAMTADFFMALDRLRQPFDQVLREHLPSCVVSDMFLPWTAEIAERHGVPRLVFHSMGFFPLCVIDSLDRNGPSASFSTGDKGTVLIPGLPRRIEMKRSQLHNSGEKQTDFEEFMERIKQSELRSYGAVVNSFYEMEPDFADHYRNAMQRKAWHVGPLCLCNRLSSVKLHEKLQSWLDSKPCHSVVYVCFGSLSHQTVAQLHEISSGLEESNHYFIWVMSKCIEGYEEGIKEQGKGVITVGWAPQTEILNHPAVGGFVTHCGMNSVLESVSAGVPMITWPLFAEQFYNEKLVVDLLGVGVKVGVEMWGMREEDKEVVRREEIRRAVCRLMDEGVETDGIRKRADEMKEKARRAAEVGGSSHTDVSRLIDALVAYKLM
ncbi:anthocyanin 3'-O-beta-glucosyltransferase-like [Typha latifolia]|uniref:anthocyanin 3'-O-beta-glucosyltransferase-like n=1 Tax=Typha latifolia TaxID=4733 RepID=UPI003C2E4B80